MTDTLAINYSSDIVVRTRHNQEVYVELSKEGVEGPRGIQGPKGDPGSPGEPLVLAVSDAADIAPGGWWATRDYHGVATFTRLRAEMLAGAAEGVSLYIEKNGLPFAGPFALSSAAPTIITGLTLVLAPGDNVSAYRVGGTLAGPWLMLLQLDGRS
ncbi:hypothetical protein [Ancylobacter rudongensis]|uniref:Uncharacterized protein n=1 Tax=Ancylobacter rudongensis TaxID=177413 RepID=A0A1G4UPZ5_9HYPH|nr:hypothetical protein [Ancylobacter rudongensis]SCW95703.1 hypothetical protein SAMN05660859_0096 [Ancylobacter rudongensis]